ncbi:MAG: 1-acyl-sn-glycerol-3-phosphate acyltransferase [Acidobacteria bacterium]|nr:1-acyl-sn-glycerol-3-phosphate acyltransferase [Acidobacteriota bacterium]
MEFVIAVIRPVALWLCRLFFKIEFQGVENIPPQGACIITPNHQAYADPIWVTIPFRRRIYYMAWAKMFRIPVLGFVMRSFGAFPVKLESTDPRAQRAALELLKRHCALVIFPEGGRTTNGKLMPFKPGAFRLALTQGIPILPVTIAGGYEIWPRHKIFPRLGKLIITFHPLIFVERLAEDMQRAALKERARQLAQQTRAVVASALAQASVETEDPFTAISKS